MHKRIFKGFWYDGFEQEAQILKKCREKFAADKKQKRPKISIFERVRKAFKLK